MTSKQVQCIFSMVSNIVGLSFCLVRNFGSSSGFATHLWPGRHLRKSMKIGLWVIPKKSFPNRVILLFGEFPGFSLSMCIAGNIAVMGDSVIWFML